MYDANRRLKSFLKTQESVLKTSNMLLAEWQEKEKAAVNDLDKDIAGKLRSWCEGRVTSREDVIRDFKDYFDEELDIPKDIPLTVDDIRRQEG